MTDERCPRCGGPTRFQSGAPGWCDRCQPLRERPMPRDLPLGYTNVTADDFVMARPDGDADPRMPCCGRRESELHTADCPSALAQDAADHGWYPGPSGGWYRITVLSPDGSVKRTLQSGEAYIADDGDRIQVESMGGVGARDLPALPDRVTFGDRDAAALMDLIAQREADDNETGSDGAEL